MLTQEFLKENLYYNQDFGIFVWLKDRGTRAKAGAIAGHINSQNNYLQMKFDKVRYNGHRLAFFYVHGRWPNGDIDHINGKPWDNRITNLRECSRAENLYNKSHQSNNKSGIKGVYWNKKVGKWYGQIKAKGKRHSIGYFETIDDASVKMEKAREVLHGKYTNHGEYIL